MVAAVAVFAAGCGNPAPGGVAPVGPGSTVPAPITPASTTGLTVVTGDIDTGDLSSPEVITITVAGQVLVVAFVDRPATRAQGLMGVENLGDLDGMLFDLEVEREANFTMRNTLIPLDIVFFAADGHATVMLRMEPCPAEPCPTYPSGEPARYALEVPADSIELTADSFLVVP